MHFRRYKLRIYIYIMGVVALSATAFACGRKYNNHYARVAREQRQMAKQKTDSQKVEDQLIKTNQILARKEQEQIKGYIDRRGWQMKQLQNGIYLSELTKGSGKEIKKDSHVTISYSLDLISGQSIIPSSKPKTQTIVMNKQEQIVGLLYVLMGQKQGAKLRIILPYFMAYGINGDGDKIPRRATLVYLLEVKDIK